jgi:hypothetical protein
MALTTTTARTPPPRGRFFSRKTCPAFLCGTPDRVIGTRKSAVIISPQNGDDSPLQLQYGLSGARNGQTAACCRYQSPKLFSREAVHNRASEHNAAKPRACLSLPDYYFSPPLPPPWNGTEVWAKCDMVFSAGFQRLDLIRLPRVIGQPRKYRLNILPNNDLVAIRAGVLCSLGLSDLTKHL